ncbi:hypothetical protein Tco_0672465 [Tanacetum coccineum]
MSSLKFAKTNNLVAFLEKPEESNRFEGIIDFLNASSIKYALTVNPIVYESCIEQFWTTDMVKTVNGERQIQALVDNKKLTLMGYENLTQKLTFYKAYFSPQWKFLIHTILQCLSAKKTACNEFSSTMASAIICLATNQNFNFSKYIFDNMIKNLEGGVKFLMYPRFVQVFLDKQVDGMSKHNGIYVISWHTKKVFANMKRGGKGFSGRVTPLFQSMMVQASEDMCEDLAGPTDSHSTPIITQPSSSKPQKKKLRRKQRKDSEIAKLKERIKKLEKKRRSINYKYKRLYKTKERNDEEMLFDVDDDLQGEEFVIEEVVEKEISTADPVATAGEVVTTASIEVTTASAPTTNINELTMAQTLIEIKALMLQLLL